jgi:signal transduction histidine kinase
MSKSPSKFERLPIKTKMTIWYTISFMAAMAFFFASFYIVTRNVLLGKIDNSLKSQTEEVVNVLKTQSISSASKEFILKTFQVTKTNLVLVLSKNNQIIAQSQTFPVDLEILSQLILSIRDNPKPHFITHEKTRFFLYPIFNNNEHVGTIIVGDSISVINEAFQALLNTLIVVFLLFLVPLILMGSLQTNILLEPLKELSKKMNTISTKNLSERVKVLNPKDEIGEVATAFNSLLDRIQKGFVKERQLIHDVSHQLKTPLTAMQSDLEIGLSKPRETKDYKITLENVLIDAIRMSDILRDMMSFAWASSDNQDKNFKKLNVSHILEEIAEIANQLGIKKNIKVKTSILHNIFIIGQKEKLGQIFLNILENAIKYSNINGKIYIQAHHDKGNAKIIIKDNGSGISKKDLPHIFERFYRGNTGKQGSGLGLSIVDALIKAHKGEIEVTSQKDKGTTIILTFPSIHYEEKKTQNNKRQKNKSKKPNHLSHIFKKTRAS